MAKLILVVDDEEMVDEVIQEHLRRAGFQTISFSDPRDALVYFQDHPSSVDLAIIDHDMPGITGSDLAEKLRAMMSGLPIIMITGHQEGIEFAEYKILKKPCTKDELLEAVKLLLP